LRNQKRQFLFQEVENITRKRKRRVPGTWGKREDSAREMQNRKSVGKVGENPPYKNFQDGGAGVISEVGMDRKVRHEGCPKVL